MLEGFRLVISIVIQVLLGVGFIMFGYQKFVSPDMKEGFKYFGYGDSFRIFTGAFEIIGAIFLLVGIWMGNLALIGAIMLVLAMVGAVFTHIKIKDTVKNMMMPIVLLLLSLIVVVMNVSA
ncbi:MAG TPA: DoxX family protein [Candidatus Pseudogracilibacillus intestinigallinarum]|uniref:DoxX family protein n=1 Tax=Candidatus Pseudogracilibacillus intestinigallinarum TaxID=2838742 RepID=A0A9D1TK09_9BACI|nr:DoxX family protein [Candidatus Pseudogracilibacillus intestinigallinarum]